jgi:hypothetical protein
VGPATGSPTSNILSNTHHLRSWSAPSLHSQARHVRSRSSASTHSRIQTAAELCRCPLTKQRRRFPVCSWIRWEGQVAWPVEGVAFRYYFGVHSRDHMISRDPGPGCSWLCNSYLDVALQELYLGQLVCALITTFAMREGRLRPTMICALSSACTLVPRIA